MENGNVKMEKGAREWIGEVNGVVGIEEDWRQGLTSRRDWVTPGTLRSSGQA
jgi:hypothetical protein